MTQMSELRSYFKCHSFSGEFVLLDASFSNLSSRRVVPEAVLCQTQTFSAGGKTRVRKSKFASLAGRAITAGSEEERWDALPLKIPAVTPTISNCGLIKVEYSIKVTNRDKLNYSVRHNGFCPGHPTGVVAHSRLVQPLRFTADCGRHRPEVTA